MLWWVFAQNLGKRRWWKKPKEAPYPEHPTLIHWCVREQPGKALPNHLSSCLESRSTSCATRGQRYHPLSREGPFGHRTHSQAQRADSSGWNEAAGRLYPGQATATTATGNTIKKMLFLKRKKSTRKPQGQWNGYHWHTVSLASVLEQRATNAQLCANPPALPHEGNMFLSPLAAALQSTQGTLGSLFKSCFKQGLRVCGNSSGMCVLRDNTKR